MGSLRVSKGVTRLGNAIASWFLDDDVNTVEKLMIWMWVAMGLMIFVLSDRILVAPPPWFKGLLPILPPRWWAMLYFMWTALLIWGRHRGSWKIRHVSSLSCLITSGFLLCPLWLKAPAFSGIMCFLVVPQAALTAHLKQLTRSQEEDKTDCGNKHGLVGTPRNRR